MSGPIRLLFIASILAVGVPFARAGDWPMWRHDARRSAASPDELPASLRLQWIRQLPKLKPAWPDQPKMQFDIAYEPVVQGQRMFVGSSYDNSVLACDTRTGSEIWKYYSDGPVRFAPLAWRDNIYFASDDGYLYCVKADDGSLVWRFRGGPSDRKILGNERLISMWPARGAPVIADEKIYFAAGIWPFMGIFIHALDARTGELLWTNDGDGSLYMKQPHNADSFAGVAPQGPLVAMGGRLLIPGGRSVPACYDRITGQMIYYQLADNGKRGGGSTVAAVDNLILNGGAAFDLTNEKFLGAIGEHVTFADQRLYDYRNGELRALDPKSSRTTLQESVDATGAKSKVPKWSIDELAKVRTPHLTALIKAGSRLYVGCQGRLLALPRPETGSSLPVWQAEIEGTPVSLVAADDKLFAVTLEGYVYCFGDSRNPASAVQRHDLVPQALENDRESSAQADAILKASGMREGYCLAWGVGSGGLISELVRSSHLRVVVIEPDVEIANAFRRKLGAAGLGADRVTVLTADPLQISLPPYVASLSVMESLPLVKGARHDLIAKIYGSLRPYGGIACLPVPPDQIEAFQADIDRMQLAGAGWKQSDKMTMLLRSGPLPGSADWTHEHADAANTRVSKDQRVKAPLGLLWFGGSSNDAVLPRHGHGPQPQVVNGRLFIEGIDMLRAMDIYTGRVLWESRLPGVGTLYANTAHQPGANASNTNFIATPDGIYVTCEKSCWKLDNATGAKTSEFQLPRSEGANEAPRWGYLNVIGDYLVGGADPVFDPDLVQLPRTLPKPDEPEEKKPAATASSLVAGANALIGKALMLDNDNYSSSRRLVVMDRQSGRVLWSATAENGFRHNAICIGGGRMYCIDRLSSAQLSRLKRRGDNPTDERRLVVYDLATGAERWSTRQDVFGTWLSYSVERDILVEAGRTARDTLSDEPKGMRAYRGSDGSILWNNATYAGPAMIHHDTILMSGSGCDLVTGQPRMRQHPLSGEPVEWTWSRNYGCNTPAASEHLLTFRSGAAGYFDFCNDGGTGNFGGFRSSCTNNLIVAGGLLNAPDYTRTCTCSYQNQTSLALVHMPEVETWTSFGPQTPKQVVRRVGINLGAPGDRKADDGTLWLEYPSVGGSSPAIPIKVDPEKPDWFRRHSSQVDGPGLAWVVASGAKGLNSLTVTLGNSASAPRSYIVRLHFAEPDNVRPGERTFSIGLQGKTLLSSLDVAKEAGGRNRSLVKSFSGIVVAQDLVVDLTPTPSCKMQSTVLSGVEIQAEGW